MSILIKGMEMPTNCQHCPCVDDDSRYCKAANEYIPMLGKPKFCPLIEVPPHGRLIDGEKAKEKLRRAEALTRAFGYHNVIDTISEVPTIIEAEEGEDNG